ncbi:hypothetical protein BCR42DRAFT_429173 [Absidia repens]|uniref:Uncharacterized protein n=1 Tax=Absidia repens TaxID=90262 RepID=A0A1X2HXA9_9FUNG|nr:hypothetical protein BCR42DRAFT_429173 [Absidia repens]
MSVQAAVAFLNGGNNDPDTTMHRPILPLSKIPSTTTTTSSFSKPPSPLQWSHHNNTNTNNTTTSRQRRPTSRSIVDMHAEELTALYQDVLDKLATANETIVKLESDVEIYACDSTKVRDYEIRVEYLAQKLEQVSDERDSFEQELMSYKNRPGNSLDTPVSACFPAQDNDVVDKNDTPSPLPAPQNEPASVQEQQQQQDETYFDDLLDAYEETDDHHQEHLEEQMAKMQAEYDQGMKMAMESYVADLARQRLENKTLQTMVQKQEELIHELEGQQQQQQQQPVRDNEDENALLHQQVELQQIELESKRDLLTQLLNERNNSKPSFRSSIDLLADMAKDNTNPTTPLPKSPGSIRSLNKYYHQARDTGRSTPPPFAPPRTPLPPLPPMMTSSSSSASVNMGMTPTSPSSSTSSSASWSFSDEHHQSQHPLSILTGPPAQAKHHMDPLVVAQTNTTPPTTATTTGSGSFWKGLKKKF